MHIVGEVLGHALLITGFVFVMMLVIEYLNLLTRGNWDRIIARWKWGQSVFSAFLGATPGCLGAFAVSSLYIHRVLTFGGLVAAMVATCGDEAFVMLTLFPSKALLVFGALFAGGTATGILTDMVLKTRRTTSAPGREQYAPTHPEIADCISLSGKQIADQWRRCSPHRGWLCGMLVLFVAGILTGAIGHHHLGVDTAQHETQSSLHHACHETEPGGLPAEGMAVPLHADPHAVEHTGAEPLPAPQHEEHREHDWNWVRITLLLAGAVGLLVVATVSDHFLDEHLWHHLVRVHAWRIFLWTLGALAVTHFVLAHIDIETAISAHRLPVLLLACLVGLIPASGPHLVFVTLFAQGVVPLSTLLANCVVQEGHGMIPLLSHSRRAVLAVKAGKLVLGLLVGILGHALGW